MSKNKEQITITIDKELKDRIDKHSLKTHIKRSVIINLAISDYFKKLDK